MRKLGLPISVALAACDSAGSLPLAEHRCPPVHASRALAVGEVITSGLRTLTLDNGIVRIRYGAHALDFQDTGVIAENFERHMDHVLAARHVDAPSVATTPGCLGACHDGAHWHDATYPWYGDGTTYSTAAPTGDADQVTVLRADQDAIELAYEWNSVQLDGLRGPGACQLGRYPECGPTMRDAVGEAVRLRDGETVRSIKKIRLWKTVRVERCVPGYFVALRSDPPLTWPEQGSRALRTGYVSARAAWACDGSAVARHPSAGAHVPLGVVDCVADVPSQMPGQHGDWPFVRVLATERPVAMASLQYGSLQGGSPGTSDLWDVPSDDGRPAAWQAFIGAAPYTSADMGLEPTPAAMDVARSLVPLEWPKN